MAPEIPQSQTAQCHNHPERKADFFCVTCQGYFCPECIDIKKYKDFTFTANICKACGGKCEELTPKKEKKEKAPAHAERVEKERPLLRAAQPPVHFWKNLPGVLIYPFRGNGNIVMLAGTGFFTILQQVIATPFAVPLAVMALYTVAYMVRIIETSAFSTDDDSPGWPEVSHWLDWFGVALVFFLAALISFGPAVAYLFKNLEFDFIFQCLFAGGLFIYPMYILIISLTEKLSALNPWIAAESIFKTFFPYLVVFAFWMIFLTVPYWIQLTPLVAIPFLKSLLEWFLLIYFLFVNMRLLGIFYRAYNHRFDWFVAGPL